MRILLTLSLFFILHSGIIAQNCLEVETILVNSCDGSNAGIEGLNEMFRFRVGANPIAISDIQIVNGWPSQGVNTLPFNGFVQNALTEAKTIELNATITESCGYLIEPPAGIIPAGERVLAITSYEVSVALNSFANLTDTLYIIYHEHSGQAGGHFLNYNIADPQEQTLRIQVNGAFPCYEEVTYIRGNLVDANGNNADQNGAFVDFSADGVPTYGNTNCQAPFEPFSADWTNPGVICENADSIDLSNYVVGTLGGTFSGNGVNGLFFNPAGLAGPVELTYTVISPNKCNNTPTSITHIVNVSPLPDISSSINALNPFCRNQSNQLFIEDQQNVNNYVWQLPAGWIGNSTSTSIDVQTGNLGGIVSVYAQNGCGDGPIQTLETIINTINTDVLENEGSLNALALNADYQWYDCSDSSAIDGETNNVFFPSFQGYYAVEITQNGCSDTSSCIQTLITSSDEISEVFKWNIYPNPIQDNIHIEGSINTSEKIDLCIYAMDGRLILNRELYFESNQFNIDVDFYSSCQGIYLLQLYAKGKIFSQLISKL
jgi:hypothetical protein